MALDSEPQDPPVPPGLGYREGWAVPGPLPDQLCLACLLPTAGVGRLRHRVGKCPVPGHEGVRIHHEAAGLWGITVLGSGVQGTWV